MIGLKKICGSQKGDWKRKGKTNKQTGYIRGTPFAEKIGLKRAT